MALNIYLYNVSVLRLNVKIKKGNNAEKIKQTESK